MDRVPLVYAIMNNKGQNLNLTPRQWEYLIDNTDLSHTTRNKRSLFIDYLVYQKRQNITLAPALVDKIFNASLGVEKPSDCYIFNFISNYYPEYASNLDREKWTKLVNRQLNKKGYFSFLTVLEDSLVDKSKFFYTAWQYMSEANQQKLTDFINHCAPQKNLLPHLKSNALVRAAIEKQELERTILSKTSIERLNKL